MPSVRAESSPPLAEPSVSWSVGTVWQYIRQITSLWSFFLTGLIVSPICMLLAVLGGWLIPPAFGQKLIAWLFSHWLRFSQAIGVFEIDFPEIAKLAELRGVIVTANHPSLVDAVLILAVMPRAVCIMRAGLMKSPFLGGAARLAGYIANDGGPDLIRGGVSKLKDGENLLIFPEGTRTQKGPVNTFKKGFALIATRSAAPIQTLFIEREGVYLAKGTPLMAPSSLPLRFRVRFGERIYPMATETPHQLAARLEEYFRSHLENTGKDIRLITPPKS